MRLTVVFLLVLALGAALVYVLSPAARAQAPPKALSPTSRQAPTAPQADLTIRLAKNEDYFDAASVAITQVTSLFIDPDEAWSRYQAGALDTIPTPASELISITESAVYSDQIHTYAGEGTIYLVFSMDVPPSDDGQMRAALASAIDRRRLISETQGGNGIPALTLTPPGQFGHVDGYALGIGHPYSPTQATALMAASGYTGTPTVTLMIYGAYHQPLADALVDMWSETLGISVTVEMAASYWDMIQLLNNGSVSERPNLFRMGWLADYPDAHNWHVDALSSLKSAARYSGDHDALASAAATETVTATRLNLYRQAEAQLVMTDTLLAPLYYMARSNVTRDDLTRTYRSAGAQHVDEWQFAGAQRPLEIAWGAPASLDPALVRDPTSVNYVEQLFLGLTDIDAETGAPRPELATGWEISDDATVYTFTLRNDVTWTDGMTVTAHDVEYAILRALNPATDAPLAYQLYALENGQAYNTGAITDSTQVGVEALDDTHVRFTMAQPGAYLPAILSRPIAYPVPQDAIETHGLAWTAAANIVTNGPYTLEHQDSLAHLTIGKSPDDAVAAGHELTFTIRYENIGGLDAVGTRITETLTNLSYIRDTAPFTHTGSGTGGDPLIWHVNTLTGYTSSQFKLVVAVDAELGEQVENQIEIGSTSTDVGQPWERMASWSEAVQMPWSYVNYSEESAGATYPVGHTFWVTVTDSGGTFKASATDITTPSGADNDGDWGDGFRIQSSDWSSPNLDIEPLDWVHFASDDGYTATIRVGTITATLDTGAATVSGTVSAPWFSGQQLAGSAGAWGVPGWQDFLVDADGGSYYVDFSPADLGPDARIGVRYQEPDGDRVVRAVQAQNLIIEVNYGHDWLNGQYEAGHSGWVTVTTSDGTLKATAPFTTGDVSGWNETGFQTEWDDWDTSQPDIQPGDYVHAWVDTGYTNTVRVGIISGTIDAAGNSISGYVLADWLSGIVDVYCNPWGAPSGTPGKNATAAPDGSTPYTCQWNPDTEWQMEPEQNLAVTYREPDGDRVGNVFQVPYTVFLPLVLRQS